MLRITMNKSASGAKKYYSEEYYGEGKNTQLDYYSEKDQSIGNWGGKAAEKLGLGNDVLKKDFANLCDNINPENGKKLTARNDSDRTVGYDFTFNACKSVTLAYTFGSDDDRKEILNAFKESVNETMKEVEKGMQARVRGKGKNENRETGNIIYGEFTHFTTRPIDGSPDPHLHSHCFVFNGTYDDVDKKWKAGQFRQIKQDAPYYEAYFHSTFAEKLKNCGYEIQRADNGFEIAGIDKGTIDKFSRRTKEIEEHAREHSITDEKEKAAIGAKTRESKRVDSNAENELAAWIKRLSADEYDAIQKLKGKVNKTEPDNNEAKQAVDHSLKHNLERKSVASDKEILSSAIRTSIGKASAEDIKEEFKQHTEVLSVKEDNRAFITTREALSEERRLIQGANATKGKFRPINESYECLNPQLNDQQKNAVKHALRSSDGITIIAGKAGTGKTTLMKEVKEGIEQTGKRIFAFAPSSEASRQVQRSEGFENADTIASLIQKKDNHKQLKNQVIWLDEAGMISNKDLNNVIAIAKEQK